MIDMAQEWKKKIDQLDEKIRNTESGKDGRLRQLSGWKANIQLAYLRCLVAKV